MQNWNLILPGCSILCGSGSHDTHLPDSPLPKNKEKVFEESLSFICIMVLLCSKTNKIFFVHLHLLSADKVWSQHQSHSFSDLSVRLSRELMVLWPLWCVSHQNIDVTVDLFQGPMGKEEVGLGEASREVETVFSWSWEEGEVVNWAGGEGGGTGEEDWVRGDRGNS